MRVLLVVPQFDLEPIGLAYISAIMKKTGHHVDLLVKRDPSEIGQALSASKYDIVATGGMSSHYKLIKNIVAATKAAGLPIIVGGSIVTSEPGLVSVELGIDYSVIGEGEETIVELMAALENGSPLDNVAGLGYFKGGQFTQTAARRTMDHLDNIPLPDWESMEFDAHLDRQKASDFYFYDIFDNPRVYPIITSRSCPYLCTFCYHPLGNKYRTRSIDSVMQELEAVVHRYRINIISVYDELFSHSEKRVFEFCRRFKEFAARVPWPVKWMCQLRVDKLTPEMLDAMKDAGCYHVGYGFESYSARVLESMNKRIAPEQIHRALHMTLERNLALGANFIFGDPVETPETAEETLAFWREHSYAGILMWFIFPCPDSKLYRYSIQKGLIKDRIDYIENHFFDTYNMTSMSDDDFMGLRHKVVLATLRHNPMAVPDEVGPNHVVVKCPHCKNTNKYMNYVVTDANIYLYLMPPSRYYFSKAAYCRHCSYRIFIVSRLYRWAARLSWFLTPTVFNVLLKAKSFISKLRLR